MKHQKSYLTYGLSVLFVLISVSYAYFIAGVNSDESVSSGHMSISFVDGNSTINAVGITSDSNTPWATKTFTVTSDNTTKNKTLPYRLSIIVDTNELTHTNMTYTLTSTNT